MFYRNFPLNVKHLHKPSVVSFNPGPFSLQLFTAMFVGFWATSAYFDHFLLTGVFCIAYGVVAEVIYLKPYVHFDMSRCQIMSKHLYGGDEIPTSEIEAKKAELARLERSPSPLPSSTT